MSTDPLRELIRQQVRAILQEEVRAAVGQIVAEEVRGMVDGALAPIKPEIVVTLPRHKRSRFTQKWGRRIKIAVNPRQTAPPFARDGKMSQVWAIARQLLGNEAMTRDDFTRELSVLMDQPKVSKYISLLLDHKALLAIPMDAPAHKVGEAYVA